MANPYHDEEGKFTSKDNQGSAKPKEKEVNSFIKLKAGVDLSNFPKPQDIPAKSSQPTQPTLPTYSGKVDTSVALTLPSSVEDAMDQGNRILGYNSVFYDKKVSMDVLHNFNKALLSVVNDFPQLFENNALGGYGNRYDVVFSLDSAEHIKEQEEICKKILSTKQWQEKLAACNYNMEDILSDFSKSLHKSYKEQAKNDRIDKSIGGETIPMAMKMQEGGLKYYPNILESMMGKPIDSMALRGGLLQVQTAIKLNPYFRTEQQWSDYVVEPIKRGFFFSDGNVPVSYGVATHELGHFVSNLLCAFMNDDEWNEFYALTTNNVEDLYKNKQISGYGKTNAQEQTAEAFQNCYCLGDNATTHNKKLFKFLKGVYNRVFGVK